MAEYVPFDEKVEVLGTVVKNITKSIDVIFEKQMLNILRMFDIMEVDEEKWYPLTNLLNALKYINDEIGPNTLFAIGKGIPKNAIFPEGIDNLEKALNSIDEAYHMNHRGGEIGYYKLVEFDSDARHAIMECYNPYPHHFDKGLLTSMTRRFAPKDAIFIEVVADTSRPTRLDGADKDWFIIKW